MSPRKSRQKRRWARAACVGLGLLTGAIAASGNGRYPFAQQLLVDPSDPNRLWLRATYGILTSPDGGKSWDWICESAVGYSSQEDPILAVTSDGRIFAGAAEGVFVTPDHGCSWSASPGVDRRVLDLAVEPDGMHVLALTTSTEPNGDLDLVIYRSDASGRGFSALGPPLSKDLNGLTVDAAPSDSSRIYVTGTVWPYAPASDAGLSEPDASARLADLPAVLARSRDGGVTWDRRNIPGSALDKPPFIAAVHPTNPDVLYVRIQGAPNASGPVESVLLYTNDAGDTWSRIFTGAADMPGFSLSKDGSAVHVGLGNSLNPNDPTTERHSDPDALGIYSATAPTFSFTRGLRGQVGCLTDTGSALYVCGSHDSDQFELGVSSDDGATATALYDLQRARGVLACPSTTATALTCPDQWSAPPVCGVLGHCTAPDAGASKTSTSAPGGCGCGSPGSEKSKSQPSTVGTARLTMLPEPYEFLVATGIVAAWLARRRRRG